ncbi:MAG: transcriptional regulator, AsnC family [Proteobacteria bacterium]|nr:transcriptional regulator, AsnC family [Pseudomonadota bacterium]
MKTKLDRIDLALLDILQQDADLPLNELASRVNLSPTPCWRRIQRMQEAGIIRRKVALLDAERLNVSVTVFVSVRAARHSMQWAEAFCSAISAIPEVVEFYRMSGDVDYLLRVVVPDIKAFDAVYKRMIASVELQDVSSSFAMEQLKYTTALPLDYV